MMPSKGHCLAARPPAVLCYAMLLMHTPALHYYSPHTACTSCLAGAPLPHTHQDRDARSRHPRPADPHMHPPAPACWLTGSACAHGAIGLIMIMHVS